MILFGDSCGTDEHLLLRVQLHRYSHFCAHHVGIGMGGGYALRSGTELLRVWNVGFS